jgi:hypothetical protein
MITNRNQVCFAKMVGCGLQEEFNRDIFGSHDQGGGLEKFGMGEN